jgi:hypothetical protein
VAVSTIDPKSERPLAESAPGAGALGAGGVKIGVMKVAADRGGLGLRGARMLRKKFG